ncbi:MAG: hypothetical protein C0469_12285 [Cyanobacteria bacterium DS2.3.42]|nr:hypothetical protein [Cyanobacteria bacterium DS2.3.42]
MPDQATVSRNWRILKILVMTVVFGTTALGLLSFVPGVWIFDQFSQFRLIYPLILAICVLILGVLRAFRLLALSLILLIVSTIPVAAMFLPSRGSTADLSARPKEISISVLNFNSEFQHNDNYKSFEDIVRTREPDVVAIVEINKKWVDALAGTMKPYPFRKFVNEGAGLALFSKYPIVKDCIASFGKSHHPRMFAELKVKDRIINVIIAHPTTPKSLSGFEERNSEIDLLADEIGAISGPKIFIGDLNCGPWSSKFQKLLKAGLKDTQQGFGPQPSWPARNGRVSKFLPIPPLIPIDHVLVSWEFSVDSRRAGPAIGSDHLPVFVKLRLHE